MRKQYVPFYQKRLKKITVSDIEKFSSLEEIASELPETTKIDVNKNPFFVFLPSADYKNILIITDLGIGNLCLYEAPLLFKFLA